jgi:hypothetical protein
MLSINRKSSLIVLFVGTFTVSVPAPAQLRQRLERARQKVGNVIAHNVRYYYCTASSGTGTLYLSKPFSVVQDGSGAINGQMQSSWQQWSSTYLQGVKTKYSDCLVNMQLKEDDLEKGRQRYITSLETNNTVYTSIYEVPWTPTSAPSAPPILLWQRGGATAGTAGAVGGGGALNNAGASVPPDSALSQHGLRPGESRETGNIGGQGGITFAAASGGASDPSYEELNYSYCVLDSHQKRYKSEMFTYYPSPTARTQISTAYKNYIKEKYGLMSPRGAICEYQIKPEPIQQSMSTATAANRSRGVEIVETGWKFIDPSHPVVAGPADVQARGGLLYTSCFETSGNRFYASNIFEMSPGTDGKIGLAFRAYINKTYGEPARNGLNFACSHGSTSRNVVVREDGRNRKGMGANKQIIETGWAFGSAGSVAATGAAQPASFVVPDTPRAANDTSPGNTRPIDPTGKSESQILIEQEHVRRSQSYCEQSMALLSALDCTCFAETVYQWRMSNQSTVGYAAGGRAGLHPPLGQLAESIDFRKCVSRDKVQQSASKRVAQTFKMSRWSPEKMSGMQSCASEKMVQFWENDPRAVIKEQNEWSNVLTQCNQASR